MRSFKGILAVLIAVVVLSPVVSHASAPSTPFVIVNGFTVPFTGACPQGTATCSPTTGTYGGATANFNIGGPSFSSVDTTTNDTLRLSNFTLSGTADITIEWSQSFSSSPGGSISYSDHMGGFFAPSFPLRTGDSVKLDGSISSNVFTTLPQLVYTVGPPCPPAFCAQSNNFTPPRSPDNSIVTVVCNIAGACSETLDNRLTFHLANPSDVITVSNSGAAYVGATIDGILFPNPTFVSTQQQLDNTADNAAAPPDVPEPASILLLGTGLTGIFLFGRKRLLRKA